MSQTQTPPNRLVGIMKDGGFHKRPVAHGRPHSLAAE